MENSPRKIPLKQYLEAVREHCQGLSKEQLVETLLNLAQEAPVRGRVNFLDKIRVLAPDPGEKKTGKDPEEALLERIAVLGEEIRQRVESIESGDYWDDPDQWEDVGYDDEEPDYVTSEQVEELQDLFLETGGIFLDGRLETASRLYRALFDFMDENSQVAGYPSPESLDIREERARYCRCVYETVDPKRRVESVLACINIDASLNDYRLDLPSERFPMLQDLIDARFGELTDLETFLLAWEKRLARYSGDRASVLRMEAVQKLKGVDGISVLARKWKSEQPRGYLFWIQCLENEGNRQEMIDVCREALDALPNGTFREQAAEYFTMAAERLEIAEYVLMGKRERFLSVPNERNLLELLGEARKQNVRFQELETVLSSLERKKEDDKYGRGNLYVKALLMAGRLQEAFREAKGEKNLGWSSGNAGVVFASILSVLTDNSSKAVTVRTLLKQYAESRGYYDEDDDGSKPEEAYKEILTGLKLVKTGEPETREYRAWVDKIGRSRIEAIVSGQHRGAYDRAAGVLGSLAEYYIISGGIEKARSLLHEFVFVKFPRHHAFRREVKSVASGSDIVKALRVI
ncbi:MAG TPA: hypothetical protein VEF34_15135 [Syntrophobacteraceae bacterium]|nr:hypothetical protein [Syntrophobacteraceae bacterium]